MSASKADLEKWAQWALQFPKSKSPFVHWNAQFGNGQHQTIPDFFCLTCTGGRGNDKNTEERTFNISKLPKKKHIGIPILVAAYTKKEVPTKKPPLDHARDIVKAASHKELIIGGDQVKDFDQYYLEVENTLITLPRGHVADDSSMVADKYDYAVAGYFAKIETPREKTKVTFGGENSKHNFMTSVDYDIIV